MADEIRFEWDEANLEHIARHEVSQEEAEQAMINDPMDDGYEVTKGEERWTSTGHTNRLRVLKLVWTLRQAAVIRVLAAFDVSRDAAREYLRTKVGL